MNTKTQHISESIVKVNNLKIGYRTKSTSTTVAENIRFELQPGELVAVVGTNGIGKSTLLKTLSGILPPLGGDILIHDINLSKITALELAAEMSLVLTEKIPAKNLTVREVIGLGRQPYTNWIGSMTEADRHIISRVISQLGLENLTDKKCYELSDGQLQRVMIGRALAQETQLIILDEPTTHLDIYHKAYILKLLKEISRVNNRCILFSSHEIDLAIQLCDKVLIMKNEVSEFDDPCKLIENNSFNELFPSDLIRFDKASGSFRINK